MGGYKVGFLNILKKKEIGLADIEDVPPMPPPGLDEEEEMAVEALSEEEFPKDIGKAPKAGKGLPPPPKIEEEQPKIPWKFNESFEEEELPELPPLPETEEGLPEFPTIPEKGFEEAEPGLSEELIKPRPVYPLRAYEERKIKVEPKKDAVKPLFIRVGAFKDVLNEIRMIKTSLEEFKENLDKKEDDALYERLKNNLNDIQRKLRFVDENLFKG